MGKPHGSLTRSGKVKALTPKVAPQEAPKPKTGRAAKRKLYNKRYASLKKGTDSLRVRVNSQASQTLRKEMKEAQKMRILQRKRDKGIVSS